MSLVISWFVVIALLASWSLLVDLTLATWIFWFAGCVLLVAVGAIAHVLIAQARARQKMWRVYREPVRRGRPPEMGAA